MKVFPSSCGFKKSPADTTRDHKNYYWGKLHGKEMLVRIQDDRGSPPVDFVLRKSAGAQIELQVIANSKSSPPSRRPFA